MNKSELENLVREQAEEIDALRLEVLQLTAQETARHLQVVDLEDKITDNTLLVYQARWLLGRAQCKLAGNASNHWLASVNDFMSRSQL